MLYSCKSNFDSCEIGKMSKYFWKSYYVRLVFNSIIVNLIIFMLMLVLCRNLVEPILFFMVLLVYSLIYFKVKLSKIVTMSMEKNIKKRKIITEMEIKFYDSYLVLEHFDKKIKIDYVSFNRAIETDTNFYLQYIEKGKKKVLIIQKNNCDLELIKFIKKTFKNIENYLEEKTDFDNRGKLKNLKLIKIIMIFLVILSILTFPLAFYTVITYSEIHNVEGINFIQFNWLFLLYLPIPIISIIMGYIYQKRGLNCLINIFCGISVSVLLFIFGLFCFVSPSFLDNQYDDYEIINNYRDIMGVEVPSLGKLKVVSFEAFKTGNISNLTIITVDYNHEDMDLFVNEIKNNENWILSTKLSSNLKVLIPTTFTPDKKTYYLFYNKTLDEYNKVPSGLNDYEIFTIKYNISKNTLNIYLFNYKN